jgi:hypothetical protein
LTNIYVRKDVGVNISYLVSIGNIFKIKEFRFTFFSKEKKLKNHFWKLVSGRTMTKCWYKMDRLIFE